MLSVCFLNLGLLKLMKMGPTLRHRFLFDILSEEGFRQDSGSLIFCQLIVKKCWRKIKPPAPLTPITSTGACK